MADKTTFIKLDRNILNWGWFKNINTCYFFIYLVLSANYSEGMFEGRIVHRGQLVRSLRTMSEECGLSVQQIRTAIKNLKSTQEITSEKTPKYTVITVKNYDKYQSLTSKSTSDQHAINTRSTSDQQQYKNNKNKKNNKNIYIAFCERHSEYDFESLLSALNAFDEMRTKIKKPMTDHARELMLIELEKIGGDYVGILNQSIVHGWQGVFPLKNSTPAAKPKTDDDSVDPMIKSMLAKRRAEKMNG